MNILKINKSNILINGSAPYVNDYYQYIVSILEYIINKNGLSINFTLNCYLKKRVFNNDNRTIKININYEHTLVKEGGRSVPKNTPTGVIKYNKDKHYFVRIEGFQKLNLGNIVTDYSIPNIINVKESHLFNSFSNKHIYIAPCIYKYIYINSKNRNIQSLTTFFRPRSSLRRQKLLDNIVKSSLVHQNINNCFDKNKLQELYQNTKVIINIHQTPHHNTFEELRCLPALQNGVIVVAEKSPLNHLIPYNDLIIWTDYDNIIEKAKEILENYEEYYSKIFTKKKIQILRNLDLKNKKNMEDKIVMR